MNKLRKNSKKKSSYASNKIEGNPLSEKQVNEVIESDERKHYLKPVIYALSDFLIMILSWLVKQSLRAFLFQEVQP